MSGVSQQRAAVTVDLQSPSRRAVLAGGAGTLLAGAGVRSARADDWPGRPVTIISPYNPGGTNDVPARIFAEGYERLLGQRFLVRNQPGAAGIVGSKAVSAATPDGYTLLSTNIGAMIVQAVVKKPAPYHPLRNFTPIVRFVSGETFIGVNADLPVKTVADLIALAKKEPGSLNYSSSGSGSFGNLVGEYFKMKTGADIVHVPGKGSADAALEMKAGRIHVMFDAIVLPQSADGRIRVLATTSRQRSPLYPNIPTSVESGGPDVSIDAWFGLFGPPGLPREIVAKLEAATRTIAEDPEVKKKFNMLALTPAVTDAAAFRTQIEANRAVMSDIVAKARLVVE